MLEKLDCNFCHQQFETVVESGLTLDYCSSCHLIWFDKDELEQYCKQNSISLDTDHDSVVSLEIRCPRCTCTLSELGQGDQKYCACRNCGGSLISSDFIDSKLPENSSKTPLQQFDGPLSIIEFLELLTPWW